MNVDIVIPVFNEEAILEKNICLLRDFLAKRADFQWRIVIADNGSTDRSAYVGKMLAAQDTRIVYEYLPIPGRGRALKACWLKSQADVVSYMDADLPMALEDFLPLIDGVARNRGIATGSRVHPLSRIQCSLKRRIISRIYNGAIRFLFRSRFSDAQCGFKAISRETAQELLPLVEDGGWFFDTEVMLYADRRNVPVTEVPVHFIDGQRTSKVNIIRTICEDISGLCRMKKRLSR